MSSLCYSTATLHDYHNRLARLKLLKHRTSHRNLLEPSGQNNHLQLQKGPYVESRAVALRFIFTIVSILIRRYNDVNAIKVHSWTRAMLDYGTRLLNNTKCGEQKPRSCSLTTLQGS